MILQLTYFYYSEEGSPSSDWEIAKNLNNRAQLLLKQEKFDEAEPLLKRAQTLIQNYYGDTENSDYAIVLDNLGKLNYMKSNFDQALKLFNEAVAIKKRTLGEKHVQVAMTLDHIATNQVCLL